ncbi:MAG TPA: carboxypeptidase regulatory-like domain-containing protein, partial [Myxococcaceae bacterium]|nr:carboxypeptidase regulatory-like domain-containing protein [Myxococcaceae bacterium]
LGDTGLSAGFRVLSASDGYLEPQVRWRRSFFDHDLLSVGTSLSGTYVSYRDPDHPPLGYRAGRGTLEAGAEFRVTPPWWIELRLMGGGSATALSAVGNWCADPGTGVAVMCPTNGTPVLDVTGPAMGVFVSGYGGLAADVLRPQHSFFHFARVAGVVAAGTMPTMTPAAARPGITQDTAIPVDQGSNATWAYWGASVTIGFGAPGEAPRPEPVPAPAMTTAQVGPATAVAPPPAPPLPDPDPANVRGQVRGPGGAPLPGATVRVVEAHVTERTDERGGFQLHVPAGRYTVRFEAEGQVPQTKTVTVTPGEQALFFVDLAPATP